jgi:hypothetical protein
VDEPTELDRIIDTWLAQDQDLASWRVSGSPQYDVIHSAVQRLKQRLKGRSVEQPAANGEYRSPYMLLMERVVREKNITADNQPKAEDLWGWFSQHWPPGCPRSESLAKRMATAVRLPAMQTGGNKSNKRQRVTPRK